MYQICKVQQVFLSTYGSEYFNSEANYDHSALTTVVGKVTMHHRGQFYKERQVRRSRKEMNDCTYKQEAIPHTQEIDCPGGMKAPVPAAVATESLVNATQWHYAN